MQTQLNDPDCTRQVQLGMSFMSFIYVQKALSPIILSRTAQRRSPAQASGISVILMLERSHVPPKTSLFGGIRGNSGMLFL